MGELSLRSLKVVESEQLASIDSYAGKTETVKYFLLLWLAVFSAYPCLQTMGSLVCSL